MGRMTTDNNGTRKATLLSNRLARARLILLVRARLILLVLLALLALPVVSRYLPLDIATRMLWS